MADPVQFIIASAWSLVCGAAGWFAHARISDLRDRKGRRLELIDVAARMRSAVERVSPASTNVVMGAYTTFLHELRGRFEVVCSDRQRDAVLRDLGARIISVKHEDFKMAPKDKDRRDVVCESLDKLIGHLKNAKD